MMIKPTHYDISDNFAYHLITIGKIPTYKNAFIQRSPQNNLNTNYKLLFQRITTPHLIFFLIQNIVFSYRQYSD